MPMKKIATLLAGAAVLGMMPSMATAQDYYARERVPNLRPVADPAENFSWTTGQWSGWSSQCSENATRTRSVSCVDDEGQPVSDASCTAARPESSQTQSIMTNCVTYSWRTGDWSQWSSQCSDASTRTRTVGCVTDTGQGAPDSACTDPRPPSSETQAIHTQCVTYDWEADDWTDWNSLCSDNARRYRRVKCVNSNGSSVHDRNCTAEKPPTSESSVQTAQCPQSPPSCGVGVVNTVYIPEMPVKGNQGFELFSLGVTQETDRSMWIVRNSNETSFNFTFQRAPDMHVSATAPAKTDVYILSSYGRLSHSMQVYNPNTGSTVVSLNGTPPSTAYTDCQ